MNDVMFSFETGNVRGERAFAAVKALYEWGARMGESFIQCGVKINQYPDDTIWSDLTEFAQGLYEIDIPPEQRRSTESPACPREVSALKASLGQLQWLVTQGCPHIAAELSLLLGYQPVATIDTCCESASWCVPPVLLTDCG
jgi:hypothetical protein